MLGVDGRCIEVSPSVEEIWDGLDLVKEIGCDTQIQNRVLDFEAIFRQQECSTLFKDLVSQRFGPAWWLSGEFLYKLTSVRALVKIL